MLLSCIEQPLAGYVVLCRINKRLLIRTLKFGLTLCARTLRNPDKART